jgi:DNA mismatch repair protein MutH
MKTFEKQLLQDLKKYKDDNFELKKINRIFNKKYFTIRPRASNTSKVTSAVWKYCKEIHLTPYAEAIYKSGKI